MELLQPSSLDELELAGDRLPLAGGTEVVPLLRDGLLEADALVDVLALSAARDRRARGSAPATTLAELEVDAAGPGRAARGRRLAASPQLRNMGTVAGNLLQSTRCWYWRLKFPCRLHGGDTLPRAPTASTASTRSSRNDFCASAHPSDLAAALLALGATLRTNRRELPVAELYRLPTEDDRAHDDARARRADPRARRAAGRRVGLPEGDGPQALGVPARRRRRRRGAAARRRSRSPASRRCRGCSTARSTTRRRCRATPTRSRSRPRSSGARAAAVVVASRAR